MSNSSKEAGDTAQSDLSSTRAKQIYQEHLDIMSAALMSGNFDEYHPHLHFPHRVSSVAVKVVVENAEQAGILFDRVSRDLLARGTTDYARIVQHAAFASETRIQGHHDCHMMRDALRLADPYRSSITLDLIDGKWYETACFNDVTDPNWDRLLEYAGTPDSSDDTPLNPSKGTENE